MRTVMSDEVFTQIFEKLVRNDFSVVIKDIRATMQRNIFSEKQMDALCTHVKSLCGDFVTALVKLPELTPRHIELIIQHGGRADIMLLLNKCKKLTPEQVSVCLKHDYEPIQVLAYRHKLCPESAKVWYNLTKDKK